MENRIRVLRAGLDMTQDDLARRLKVTRQTIISIEGGKYDPSLALAFKISKFFDSNIEDVFIPEGKVEKK